MAAIILRSSIREEKNWRFDTTTYQDSHRQTLALETGGICEIFTRRLISCDANLTLPYDCAAKSISDVIGLLVTVLAP